MKIARSVIACALLALVPGIVAAHGTRRFEGGMWWTGAGFEARTYYAVDGILRASWDGSVDEVVSLAGRFVVPPLADAHNHGFADGRDPSAEIASWLARGIFYVKNPNNLPRLTAPIRPKVNNPESLDVRYSNGGFTSPGGHPSQIYLGLAKHLGFAPAELEGEAFWSIASREDLEAAWPRFLATKPDFVKVYLEHSEEHAARAKDATYVGKRGLAPELVAPLVERAHAAKLSVTAHVATAADFRTAVAAGCDEIAHLPLERLSEADADATARAGVTVVTTTLSHRPTEGIEDLDGLHRDNLRLLASRKVKIALGVDSDRSVLDEIDNLRRLGVFEPAELLRIAVEVTPAAIFPGRRIGRLAEGYEASFLALPGNPLEDASALRKPALRVKQGHVLRVDASAVRRPSVADALGAVAAHQGAASAIAEYERLQRESPNEYTFGEAPLNDLGYALLRHGRLDDAIEILRYNARLFPRSANVWDSLAEALMTRGDRAGAIENYHKSLELNPANANARKMLEQLGAER